MCLLGVIAAFAVVSGEARASVATPLGGATGYNAFIFSNFTESGTDSEGRIAVGGNFAPSNGGFTIASQRGSDKAGTYDLVVGGNYTNIYNVLGGGDLFVGGNMNWTDPTLQNNAYVNGNVTNSSYGSVGGTLYYGGNYSSTGVLNHAKMNAPMAMPIDFLSVQTSLDSLSNSLASQAANTTVAVAYNTYTMTGTDKTLNVFNLTDSNFNGSTINISAPSGSTVVINVAGASDSFNGGSINFSGVSAKDVIFNFAIAKSLALANIGFNGTILAPYATVNTTFGQLNGQLIANNVNGTMELHDVAFQGTLPSLGSPTTVSSFQSTATPEPSTWMLGFPALVFVIRQAALRSISRRSGPTDPAGTLR
jgi:choice-of-anchor A domain-containing protein